MFAIDIFDPKPSPGGCAKDKVNELNNFERKRRVSPKSRGWKFVVSNRPFGKFAR